MFEDQNQNQSPASGVPVQPTNTPPSTPKPSTTAPKHGVVEDIFADTDSSVPQQPQPNTPIQPASSPQFQSSSNAIESGKLKPANSSVAQVPSNQISDSAKKAFPFVRMLVIGGLSIGIVVLSIGGFLMWKGKSIPDTPQPVQGPPQDTPPPIIPPTDETTEPLIPPIETQPSNNESESGGFFGSFQQRQIDKALNPIPQDPASIDTDEDGLSDAKEFEAGTNPRLVDSDNDGLSDWEEIAIFGTDPLNSDTDSDSFLDGEEVQNGYNPLGSGKLLNIESAQ